MSKANRNKRKKEQLSFNKTKVKWEDLLERRKVILDTFVNQIAVLNSLIMKYKDKIENNKEAQELVKGLNLSYNDLSKKIRFNIEQHVNFKFNMSSVNSLEYFLDRANDGAFDQLVEEHREDYLTEVDYKKGIIKDNKSDEFFLYLNIDSNYISLGMELATLSSQPLLNFIYSIGVMDNEKEEFNKLEQSIIDENKKFENDVKEIIDEVTKEDKDGK